MESKLELQKSDEKFIDCGGINLNKEELKYFENIYDAYDLRKSTLQKFSKEVFILFAQIVDYHEEGDHTNYVIKVKGRTKYLVNLQEMKEMGLIDGKVQTISHPQNPNKDY